MTTCPDAPCRTISVRIGSEELDLDVCDCQPIPALPEYITVLLLRYYYRPGSRDPSALIAGCRVWLVGGSLRASIYTDEECRTLTGEDAHKALRYALRDAAGLLREMALGRIA